MKTNNKVAPSSLQSILDSLGFENGVLYPDSDLSPITECVVSVYYRVAENINLSGMVAEISLDGTKITRPLMTDKQSREMQLINIVESAKMAAEFSRKESHIIDGYFGIRTQEQQKKFCHSIKTGTVEILFQPDIDNMCKFRIATNMLLGGKPFAVVNCANTPSAAHAAKVMLATLLPNVEEIGFLQQMVANADEMVLKLKEREEQERREQNEDFEKEGKAIHLRMEEKSNEE